MSIPLWTCVPFVDFVGLVVAVVLGVVSTAIVLQFGSATCIALCAYTSVQHM